MATVEVLLRNKGHFNISYIIVPKNDDGRAVSGVLGMEQEKRIPLIAGVEQTFKLQRRSEQLTRCYKFTESQSLDLDSLFPRPKKPLARQVVPKRASTTTSTGSRADSAKPSKPPSRLVHHKLQKPSPRSPQLLPDPALAQRLPALMQKSHVSQASRQGPVTKQVQAVGHRKGMGVLASAASGKSKSGTGGTHFHIHGAIYMGPVINNPQIFASFPPDRASDKNRTDRFPNATQLSSPMSKLSDQLNRITGGIHRPVVGSVRLTSTSGNATVSSPGSLKSRRRQF